MSNGRNEIRARRRPPHGRATRIRLRGEYNAPMRREIATPALLAAALAAVAWGCKGTSFNTTGTAPAGSFAVVPTPPLHRDRAFHTATTLSSGDVLLAGGVDGNNAPVAEAERYKSLGQQWLSSGILLTPRSKHTATLLVDNTVLAAGGDTAGGVTSAAEIYRPGTNDWAATPNALATARRSHTATAVSKPQVSVIIAGGEDATGAPTASVERYIANVGFQPVAHPLLTARTRHTATLLDDGRVLIAGGFDAQGVPLTSVEFYDPATEVSVFGNHGLNVARGDHAAIMLAGGTILIVGGKDSNGAGLQSAEVYDPRNDTSTNTPSGLTIARASPVTTILIDGRVLVTGNGATAEIFDPGTSAFTVTGANLAQPREHHTATLLSSTEVLIFGGSVPNAPAEFFEDQ
jgi:hypothetical protein